MLDERHLLTAEDRLLAALLDMVIAHCERSEIKAKLEFQRSLDLEPTSAEARTGLFSLRGERSTNCALALTQTSSTVQRITTNGCGCACGEAYRPAGQLLLSY